MVSTRCAYVVRTWEKPTKVTLLVIVWFSCLSPGDSASLPFRRRQESQDRDPLDEMWLEDFETVPLRADEEAMQADSPKLTSGRNASQKTKVDHMDDVPRCPPPLPSVVVLFDIQCSTRGVECRTDSDCSQYAMKCCYNGCRHTCVAPVQAPPYIDWVREPRARLTSGNSWLIQGPEEEQQVDWCSTSYIYDDVTDDEPLLCPHGYMCQLEDPGDIEHGVPNRGRCVHEPETTGQDTANQFKIASLHSWGDLCLVSNLVYNDGDSFNYGRHTCTCEAGSVMCRVGKKSTATDGL